MNTNELNLSLFASNTVLDTFAQYDEQQTKFLEAAVKSTKEQNLPSNKIGLPPELAGKKFLKLETHSKTNELSLVLVDKITFLERVKICILSLFGKNPYSLENIATYLEAHPSLLTVAHVNAINRKIQHHNSKTSWFFSTKKIEQLKVAQQSESVLEMYSEINRAAQAVKEITDKQFGSANKDKSDELKKQIDQFFETNKIQKPVPSTTGKHKIKEQLNEILDVILNQLKEIHLAQARAQRDHTIAIPVSRHHILKLSRKKDNTINKYNVIEQIGDGNCLLRSCIVALLLTGENRVVEQLQKICKTKTPSVDNHLTFRRAVTKYIEDSWESDAMLNGVLETAVTEYNNDLQKYYEECEESLEAELELYSADERAEKKKLIDEQLKKFKEDRETALITGATDKDKVREYIQRANTDTFFCSAPHVYAISKMFNVTTEIYIVENNRIVLDAYRGYRSNENVPVVHLQYINGDHFNVYVPIALPGRPS